MPLTQEKRREIERALVQGMALELLRHLKPMGPDKAVILVVRHYKLEGLELTAEELHEFLLPYL